MSGNTANAHRKKIKRGNRLSMASRPPDRGSVPLTGWGANYHTGWGSLDRPSPDQ